MGPLRDIAQSSTTNNLEKMRLMKDQFEVNDIGLVSTSITYDERKDKAKNDLIKLLVSYHIIKNPSYIPESLCVRDLVPKLDLKKGLGTKRKVGEPVYYEDTKKWEYPRDEPLNKPERFIGEDLNTVHWEQYYKRYDYDEQEFEGSLSVYTTNFELEKSPIPKTYIMFGVQASSNIICEFIQFWKKGQKLIQFIPVSCIDYNKPYMFQTPIMYNLDLDIRHTFKEGSSLELIRRQSDNIKIIGLVCESIGLTMMG